MFRRLHIYMFIVYMLLTAVMVAAFTWIRQGPVFQISPVKAGRDSTIHLRASINPNPARESLVVTMPMHFAQTKTEFALLDQQGRILRTGLITGTQTFLDVSELKNGTYFIRVTTHQREVAGFKFIKIEVDSSHNCPVVVYPGRFFRMI